MNIVTKIAFSLSLIALIAQPIQAASYANHLKKTGKIIWLTGQTIAGSYLLAGYLLAKPEERAHFNRAYRNSFLRSEKPSMKVLSGCINHSQASLIAGPALLYHGIKGLKEEICPKFNPAAWIKSKLGKETEQSV